MDWEAWVHGWDVRYTQWAFVFGLIDYSNRKQTYPFIADAPISRLTEDTKLSFFETIINDDILSQNIIICMDLWDNKKNNINQLAGSVLELLETNKPDDLFVIIGSSNEHLWVQLQILSYFHKSLICIFLEAI